ncbi:MAG: endonuclease/exonuclease/phosphatase family protein [Verrucomicrobiae bacterium]|nr:endonuclease/exonuclease/phosphatase family protein [Verrucomicrobiae bacterium]
MAVNKNQLLANHMAHCDRAVDAKPQPAAATVILRLICACFPLVAHAGTQETNDVSAAKPPIVLRVMTYNIHHGEGTDGRVDLGKIADVIKAQKVDIVGLQEVDKGVARSGRLDFPAQLASLTKMTCVFSNNFNYQGGEYGNAILSRHPVLFWTNTHLKMLRSGEQRGLLQAVIDVEGRRFVFMVTHIDYRRQDEERIMNVDEFKQIAKLYHRLPLIICGDFNDTPGSRTYNGMAHEFTDVWTVAGTGPGFTFPSQNPSKRIDYVWIRKEPDCLFPLRAWTVNTTASDHLPVVAEIRWTDL